MIGAQVIHDDAGSSSTICKLIDHLAVTFLLKNSLFHRVRMLTFSLFMQGFHTSAKSQLKILDKKLVEDPLEEGFPVPSIPFLKAECEMCRVGLECSSLNCEPFVEGLTFNGVTVRVLEAIGVPMGMVASVSLMMIVTADTVLLVFIVRQS